MRQTRALVASSGGLVCWCLGTRPHTRGKHSATACTYRTLSLLALDVTWKGDPFRSSSHKPYRSLVKRSLLYCNIIF